MHRFQFTQAFELGWRAAGALERENEGPQWMRRLLISHRVNLRSDYGGMRAEWHEKRPKNQMM